MRSSLTMMLPAASVVAWKIGKLGSVGPAAGVNPRTGLLGHLVAQVGPTLGRGKQRTVPGLPVQFTSARDIPGAAFCWLQCKSVRCSTTEPMAHSICGHNAEGAECTKSTPLVIASDMPSSDLLLERLPQRQQLFSKDKKSFYSILAGLYVEHHTLAHDFPYARGCARW